MSLPRLVLCLALLASSLGFAQEAEEWTPYTPPAAESSPPPPLIPADPPPPDPPPPPKEPKATETARPSPPESPFTPLNRLEVAPSRSSALRLVASPFTGVLGGVIGGMATTIAGSIFMLPFCTDALRDLDSQPGCVSSFFAIATLGVAGGATTGIYFTGRGLGGRGQFLPTITGSVVGATIGGIVGVISQSTLALFLGLGVGPIVGAFVGYEISHALTSEPTDPKPRKLIPFLSVAPGGGVLGGLTGRF
jgi:hypothetical protein